MIDILTPLLGAAAPSFIGRTAAGLVQRKLGKALADRAERKRTEEAYESALQALAGRTAPQLRVLGL